MERLRFFSRIVKFKKFNYILYYIWGGNKHECEAIHFYETKVSLKPQQVSYCDI